MEIFLPFHTKRKGIRNEQFRRGGAARATGSYSATATRCPVVSRGSHSSTRWLSPVYKLAEHRRTLLADDARSIISPETMRAPCSPRRLVIDTSSTDKSCSTHAAPSAGESRLVEWTNERTNEAVCRGVTMRESTLPLLRRTQNGGKRWMERAWLARERLAEKGSPMASPAGT